MREARARLDPARIAGRLGTGKPGLRSMEEIDVWGTAQALIAQHGDGAELAATRRRDAMVQRGDWEGVLVWHRVMTAVARLRSGAAERGAKP